MWSSETLVSATTRAPSTFVASSRPPSPASTTATSTPRGRELGQRGGRQHLELRRPEPLGRLAHARRAPARGRRPRRPPGSARSSPRRAARCTRPRSGPRARGTPPRGGSRSTCRSCRPRGWPGTRAAARRARRGARASARGRTPPATGESDSSQSRAERIELAAVALELLALGLDDVLGRALHEALVGKHPLGAGDLARAAARPRRRRCRRRP